VHIVIIGVGEVGRFLAETLSAEGHAVQVVDRDAEALARATEHADIQSLAGNGASLATLRGAGVDKADLFVAVTDSDEVNMLAALTARSLGARQTIARVSDRSYYEEEGGVAHNVVGIDLLLNPQVLAAMEVHRVVRSFGVLEARNLADNRVEVVDVPVGEKTRYVGRQLRDIAMPRAALVAGIVRGDRLLIPHGGDEVLVGDHIWIVGDIDSIPRMKTMFGGSATQRTKRVIIVGGGEIGLEVARRLERDRIQVVIIERNLERCRELTMELKDPLVVHGDGTNRALLVEEGVDSADGFLTLTRQDEVNVMAGLLARGLGVSRTIALIHRADYLSTASQVGLDVAISPRRSAAEHILAHVRSKHVSRIVRVEEGRGEILEIEVPTRARVLGRSLMYIDFPRGALIGCVVRDMTVFIPLGTDEIFEGETVVVFTLPEVREDVLRLFRDPRARR